jgi:hypothetical protein
MYFNQRRCLLKANQQLLPKGDPKFAKFYDDAGKSFADLEMINGNRFNDDVREKYHDLLTEIPEVKAAYEKAVTENKGKAKALAKQRRSDAEELQKKGDALPPDSPDKPKVESRVKLLNDEAAWMDSWAENKDMKLFTQKPGPTN